MLSADSMRLIKSVKICKTFSRLHVALRSKRHYRGAKMQISSSSLKIARDENSRLTLLAERNQRISNLYLEASGCLAKSFRLSLSSSGGSSFGIVVRSSGSLSPLAFDQRSKGSFCLLLMYLHQILLNITDCCRLLTYSLMPVNFGSLILRASKAPLRQRWGH